MTTAIASLLIAKPAFFTTGRRVYKQGILVAFDSQNQMITGYPAGTSLEVAQASAAYHDSGELADLQALLALENNE